MHIDKLPLVPLVKIFSYIDDFSDKIALERVCRKWHRTMHLDWEQTKTCPKPLNDRKILGLVLKRCGKWLNELWLRNVGIDENLVRQMAKRMNCLKHLKLSKCQLDGPAVNSITELFGQQLYSFILDEKTLYHPNMRRLIENASKLEHLSLHPRLNYSVGTLPTKLPNNLKSLSFGTPIGHPNDSANLLLNMARDCNNLKILHLGIYTLLPNMILAIAKIKSLVYLNLAVDSIENETAFKNVISHELSNIKALNIGGYCSKEMLSIISRDRPDLVHLNVYARNAFQISDSLNSLTLRMPVNFGQFLPGILLSQQNKSIQHLDIRSSILPSSSKFIKELFGQFPDLKTMHCEMPKNEAKFTSFFSSFEKHLEKGRKITIYIHFGTAYRDVRYSKYILPEDLPQFNIGLVWKPKVFKGNCENLVLKKLIKEAFNGGNEPSFLDDWWME